MSQSPGLTPLSADVKARRRRQNRIIVALIVLVIIPAIAIVGGQRYSSHLLKEWMSHPTVNLNATGTVHLDDPGAYIVWTLGAQAQCEVRQAGANIAASNPVTSLTTSATGFFRSATFTAPEAGDYQVTCLSSQESGYALISTESPVASMGLSVTIGVSVGVISIIVGLVLLILGLSRNSRERAAELQAPSTLGPPAATMAPWSPPTPTPTTDAPPQWPPVPPSNHPSR
ncbi:MAG: hypothetical protein LBV00_10785 [Propionibacteriaceae bacterium]|jgi:nitrate reductase NapE component|nr:hypothetical protein [Propionibacteriaceae bacterium]